ncbi:MAG: cyclic nucleotide-binding domain-containing protein [Actinomycetes bacterium]
MDTTTQPTAVLPLPDTRGPDVTADQLAVDLGRIGPWDALTAAERAAVVAAGRWKHVAAGATLVAQGDPGDGIWTLLEGRAEVVVQVDGDRVRVGTLAAGDTFGELAALTGAARTASVVALEPSRLFVLPRAALGRAVAAAPSLGLALARGVAADLLDALGVRDEQAARAGGGPVDLPAADLGDLRAYKRRYYASAVRNIAKRHRLLVDDEAPRYRTTFRLSTQEQVRWFELFGAEGAARRSPFTFHTTSGTLLLMRIVEDVGVNFRHLLHLRSDLVAHPGGRTIEPEVDHVLEAELADVVEVGDDKVALLIDTRVHAPDGELVAMHREAFVILAIEPDAMAALRASPRFGATDASHLQGLARRERRLDPSTARVVEVEVPEDLGARYGEVSGDLNVVHTTPRAAKLFGHPRPFVQGLCTANHVAAAIASVTGVPVQQLDVSFARRVFVGQTVQVLLDGGAFEVVDARGRLAAFGTYRLLGA